MFFISVSHKNIDETTVPVQILYTTSVFSVTELTPGRRARQEKLVVFQLVEKYLVIYGIRRSITASRHWPRLRHTNSIQMEPSWKPSCSNSLLGNTSSRVAQSVQCLTTDWTTGVRSPSEAKNFISSLCVQTNSEAHPTSYPMGIGVFSRG
jgi:hypothetical protein